MYLPDNSIMNILGVGPLELILVLLIVFLVLGPKDMVSSGRKLGRFLRTARKSEIWNGVIRVKETVRDLPATLIREAELEDVKKEIEQNTNQLKNIPKEFQLSDLNEIIAENKSSMEAVLNKKDTPSIAEASDKV